MLEGRRWLTVYAIDGLLAEAEAVIKDARQMIEACGPACATRVGYVLLSIAQNVVKCEQKIQNHTKGRTHGQECNAKAH